MIDGVAATSDAAATPVHAPISPVWATSTVRWLGIFAALILLAGAIVRIIGTAVDPVWAVRSQLAEKPKRFGFGPADYATAMGWAERDISLGEERVRRAPNQWAYQEYLAGALLARARLNGSFDDLSRAQAALARGLSDAPAGAGPLLAAAVSNMTVHRLAPVAPLLAQLAGAVIPADRDERSEAIAIAGDLAFYSGRYAEARQTYAGAAALQEGAPVAIRLANWHMKMGQFDAALAQIEVARKSVKTPTRLFHANLLLQKGSIEMARGDWQAAEVCFTAANTAFPGYWRIQVFVAQMAAARGDLAAAEKAYRAIIARAPSGDAPPEVMDALAGLYRTAGDGGNSRVWADRAAAGWARRLAMLPEAAVGHALEHELVLGSPAKALDLARRNFAARPYGDALVMLGWAQLANGQPEAAARTMTGLEASGWRTAQQYVVLSEALALLGRSDASQAARSTALAINPRSFDPAASLLWFGNH